MASSCGFVPRRTGRELGGDLEGAAASGDRAAGKFEGRYVLRRLGRQRTWTSEVPALPEPRPHSAGEGDVLLGLDALGEDQGTRPLGLGLHSGDDPRDLGGPAGGDEAEVELEHIGLDERKQPEGPRVRADVVERDAPAARARLLDERKQVGRTGRQRLLRDLHDQAQVAGLVEVVHGMQRARAGREADRRRLDVDEEEQLSREARSRAFP